MAAHLNNALSTLIVQQVNAAISEILRLQAALREHKQIPVITIDVLKAINKETPLNTEQLETTVAAEI